MNVDWDDVAKMLIGAVVVIAIAWAPVSCVRSTNDKIEAAIQNGTDPIIAACAFGSSNGSSTTCTVAAAVQRGASK